VRLRQTGRRPKQGRLELASTGDFVQNGTVQVLCSEDAGRKKRGAEQRASRGGGSRVERAQGSVGYQTDAGSLTL
jgi:hypothetical protein